MCYLELVNNLRCCNKDVACDECTYFHDEEKCCGIDKDAADAIEELLTAVPQWISVEERLPEENKQIISYLAYKGMSVLQYENKHFYMQGAFQPLPKEAVTHWMPLPAPPKGGNHDN